MLGPVVKNMSSLATEYSQGFDKNTNIVEGK